MSAGPTGIQGPQGLQGVQGLQGIQGPTGLQGVQGLQGLGPYAWSAYAATQSVDMGGNTLKNIGSVGIGTTNPVVALDISGTTNHNGPIMITEATEVLVPLASPGTSTTISWLTGAVYYITGMTANFTVNITNLPTTANRSYVITLVLIQGSTPYYPNVLQVAGTGVTINWYNAAAPTATANRKEAIALTLHYTGGTWLALGQLTSFG